ncbi:U-box domain-containing protein 33 isoform X2 [Cornus florida]|uniref:U-box domain-containing protein 33 isoform X2 n=1 Tax=Cornus florida TaxID=4283 RepID=UPI00289FB8D1|nr:U-box domain-containing protein 33 isoform X2 [Cornus florida]
MAVVSPMPAIPQQINPIRYPNIEISRMMASRNEIVEEAPVRMIEDRIYVTVGKEVKESKYTLSWALHNSGGRKVCILHVHQPAQMIPMMGTKFPVSRLEHHQVRSYRETERENMQKLLNEYSIMCEQAGVRAEILHIEMDSIEKGIVELISKHCIRRLVMGAAAYSRYSKKMTELKSKKAIYVRLQAPVSCHIWFICKGNLVHTRQGRLEVASPSLHATPITETGQSSSLQSPSVIERQKDQLGPDYRRVSSDVHGMKSLTLGPDYRRVSSDVHGMKGLTFSSSDSTGGVSPHSRLNAEGSSDESDGISRRSPSLGSRFSSCSSSEVVNDLSSFGRTEGSENELELRALPHLEEDQRHSSSPSVLAGILDGEFYDQLEQTMAEAENSKREAFEESIRRRKAEKDAIEAIRRAKASEILHYEEMRKRKEIEEAVARGKEELEMMKQQANEVMEELRTALEQKSLLESQIANSNQMVQELEQKMFSAVELLQNYKKERDQFQVERDNALSVAEDLRKKQAEEASSTIVPRFFSEFSLSEIEEATCNFDPSLKVGEGGYGSIYKGCLRHTQVAIKMLHPNSLQGPSEFQQEVDVLSKLRHPNLVTLIGACPDAWALIYEYLPNGSLEDRLNCRENTPPLSWQTRIRIAAELCNVLIFLHSCNPHSIVHGDLKPANILLDANFVSKLSDFGICRVLSCNESSSNHTTLCCRTDPKGTFAYMDPEFLSTGELTSKSDVYSFGIILLRLLTGRPALGITKEVQYALDKGNLKNLLDPTAGDWPFVQAKQLAHLAVRCCEMNRKSRPDFATEVWRILEAMRVSCGASSFRLGSEEHREIPSYFICPIFQEVMQDPHVAADGFTYEAEALRGWLDSGHDTSPMTNLKLAHTNLVPNHALRSAIQEWLPQP